MLQGKCMCETSRNERLSSSGYHVITRVTCCSNVKTREPASPTIAANVATSAQVIRFACIIAIMRMTAISAGSMPSRGSIQNKIQVSGWDGKL